MDPTGTAPRKGVPTATSAEPDPSPTAPSGTPAANTEVVTPVGAAEAAVTPAPAAAGSTPAADGMQSRGLPPVQLPSPDYRGRPVTARLELIEDAAGRQVRIDLEPADLGRVEIALRLDEAGTAAATFTVDRPETLQLLQRDARAVNEMLSAAGFTVDQGGLDFTLRDSGGRTGGGERRSGPAGRQDHGSGAEGATGQPTLRQRRGLLDLRV
jgi:flagellar hook-length control protein FliK